LLEDGIVAELAEIDENLIREELTVLERGEQLARRKEIYEALHPEARTGAGRPPKNSETVSPFSADVASKTGLTPRTVQQDVQIATQIAEDVRDMLRETPLADSRRCIRRRRLTVPRSRDNGAPVLPPTPPPRLASRRGAM
jgi:ParB family chromosome partitioning protein